MDKTNRMESNRVNVPFKFTKELSTDPSHRPQFHQVQ